LTRKLFRTERYKNASSPSIVTSHLLPLTRMTIRTDATDSLDCNYFQYGKHVRLKMVDILLSLVQFLDRRNPTPADSRHTLVQLWSFRCLVQSTLLNTRNQLNGDDLVAVSNQLRILEESIDFKLAHILQKELQLKKISYDLLEVLTEQHCREVNIQNNRQLEPQDQIKQYTLRRSQEHCTRRSKRIAWKTPRRSTHIVSRNSTILPIYYSGQLRRRN
jgi:hypothetical protein